MHAVLQKTPCAYNTTTDKKRAYPAHYIQAPDPSKTPLIGIYDGLITIPDNFKEPLEEMCKDLKIDDWDGSEILTSKDEMNAYLAIAFESGDPKQIIDTISDIIKAQIRIETKESQKNEASQFNIYDAINQLGYKITISPKNPPQTATA